MDQIAPLLEKYNHFKYEQIRSVVNLTETSKRVTLVVQDDDGEDIASVDIEFSGITASKILKNEVLSFIDMSSGITLIKEHGLYGFSVGSGSAMLHVHNAPLYIIASEVSISEAS